MEGDDGRDYVLGQSEAAARRLEIQDAHFAEASERLLDELTLRPNDRVVELGCGPGTFSRRILQRLGAGGVLIGVDATEGLLNQVRSRLAGVGPAYFEPVKADIIKIGSWLDEADVVVGRAVLHHVPLAEILLGQLRAAVPPGTRWLPRPRFPSAARTSCLPGSHGPDGRGAVPGLGHRHQSALPGPWPLSCGGGNFVSRTGGGGLSSRSGSLGRMPLGLSYGRKHGHGL